MMRLIFAHSFSFFDLLFFGVISGAMAARGSYWWILLWIPVSYFTVLMEERASRPRVITQPDLPAGMKPWHGGDRGPIDWDRSTLALRRNGAAALGLDWRHHSPGHHRFPFDIVAYFPKGYAAERSA